MSAPDTSAGAILAAQRALDAGVPAPASDGWGTMIVREMSMKERRDLAALLRALAAERDAARAAGFRAGVAAAAKEADDCDEHDVAFNIRLLLNNVPPAAPTPERSET